MAAYNALGIFFGIGQTRLPRKFFSRILLLLFVWFCLIFRTCYQSKIFEFMTSDMRKPLPESIEDLIKWNYIVLVKNREFEPYDEHINRQMIGENSTLNVFEVWPHEFVELYTQALRGNSSGKYAFFASHEVHTSLSSDNKNSLPVIKKDTFSMMSTLKMSNNDMMFKHLDFVMQQFVSAGIDKFLIDHAMWDLARPYDLEIEDSRRILAMSDLEFGFVIWLAACFVAFLIFVGEKLSMWIKLGRKFKRIVGLVEFLRVLKARMADYHDGW
jgi:hypothetical protein